MFWLEMLLMTICGVCSIFLSLIIGIAIALMTWENKKFPSSFLPNYILEPPFQNYSTIFVLIGISIPIILLFYKNKGVKISYQNDTI
jgi:ABC-type amino acid transport system permease subunit